MSVLIKQATVVDPQSPFNGKKVSIGVKRGKIEEIGRKIVGTYSTIIEGKDLVVSTSWVDVHAQFNDPGYEHKEDLQSGAAAAKAGGYGTVVLSAHTHPITQSKAHVKYIAQRAQELPITVRTLAALSEDLKGKNFNELYDLHLAGAVGFSDGHLGMPNADLLKRALLYADVFHGKIMVYPHDAHMGQGGVMHEGPMSTQLGLKSDPSLSEELMVARDLAIAEYCEAPIHFMTISSAKSVQLIKNAKAKGLAVTCDVAMANLVWTDEDLASFDSNFKVTPPLRGSSDKKALIKGVVDGTIDFIVSNHTPQNIEEKDCEFNHAAPGQSSIQTVYNLYQTYLAKDVPLDTFIHAVTTQPREVLGLPAAAIALEAPAQLTVFQPSGQTAITPKMWKSKSYNTPVQGATLAGAIIAVI